MRKKVKETNPAIKLMQSDLENTFKDNVASVFKSNKIVQSNFADENGWDVSFFNKMMKADYGHGLTFSTMVKISYCLKIPLNELLDKCFQTNKKI